MDATKLKHMTMAMRLIGFAEGLSDHRENETLRRTLNDAGKLLLADWNAYAAATGYDVLGEDGKPIPEAGA